MNIQSTKQPFNNANICSGILSYKDHVASSQLNVWKRYIVTLHIPLYLSTEKVPLPYGTSDKILLYGYVI